MSNDIFSQIIDLLESIPFWGWIVLTGFVIFCFAVIMGTRDTKKTGNRVGNIIKGMDHKYNKFINTKISNKIITDNSIILNKDELFTSAITVLKPDIESLISLINCTQYEHVEVSYDSRFFNNIVALCQELFKAGKKNESKTLSSEEENKIYQGIKDSILADLITRTEELKKV